MSEKLHLNDAEIHHSSPENKIIHNESLKNHHEKNKAETKTQSKEEIYRQLEVALANKEQRAKEQEATHHERPHHYITKTVKKGVYKHTIKNVQTYLKPAERRFSKIVHNDTIETLSELGAGTVARPSAILGGGVVMVFGGLALLLTARYFGFVIPMSSLIALYVIGFVLLLVIDLLAKPFKKRFAKKN